MTKPQSPSPSSSTHRPWVILLRPTWAYTPRSEPWWRPRFAHPSEAPTPRGFPRHPQAATSSSNQVRQFYDWAGTFRAFATTSTSGWCHQPSDLHNQSIHHTSCGSPYSAQTLVPFPCPLQLSQHFSTYWQCLDSLYGLLPCSLCILTLSQFENYSTILACLLMIINSFIVKETF